jgi:hypothetical protein
MCGWSTNIYCCFTEGQVVIASLDQTRDMEMPVISLLPLNMSRYVNCKTTTSGKQNRRGIFFFQDCSNFYFILLFQFNFVTQILLTRSKKPNLSTRIFTIFCPFKTSFTSPVSVVDSWFLSKSMLLVKKNHDNKN